MELIKPSLVLNYDNNVAEYGHYEVGNLKFINKADALSHSKISNKSVYWNFREDVFDAYDWSVEPTETLEELYVARCRQLRQDYDYLVLHYGGGHDCQNILDICIKHNIPIDELLITGVFVHQQDAKYGTHANNNFSECWEFGIPYANYVKETHFPQMKITVHELQQDIRDFFKNNPDWIETHGSVSVDPGVLGRRVNYNRLQPHYLDIVRKGKKLAHVVGVEKPTIMSENDFYYFRPVDNIVNRHIVMHNDPENLPHYTELFYWHPNCAKMIIKQCHVLCRQYIKDRYVVPEKYNRQHEDYIAKALYDRKYQLTFTTDKADLKQLLLDYSWWWPNEYGTKHHENWKKGLLELMKLKQKENMAKTGANNIDLFHLLPPSHAGKKYPIMKATIND